MLLSYKEPCPYFDTKPENVPVKLLGAIQTAESFKEQKMLGLLKPDLGSLTAFEYECYRTAEYAANTIEAEETAEAIRESKKASQQGMEKFGANLTVTEQSPYEDPFKDWES